jgi:hypothetical protein
VSDNGGVIWWSPPLQHLGATGGGNPLLGHHIFECQRNSSERRQGFAIRSTRVDITGGFYRPVMIEVKEGADFSINGIDPIEVSRC